MFKKMLAGLAVAACGSAGACNVDLASDPLSIMTAASIVADAYTTDVIMRDGGFERGPIASKVMGHHPSREKIIGYFAGVAFAHAAIRCSAGTSISAATMSIGFAMHAQAAAGNVRVINVSARINY